MYHWRNISFEIDGLSKIFHPHPPTAARTQKSWETDSTLMDSYITVSWSHPEKSNLLQYYFSFCLRKMLTQHVPWTVKKTKGWLHLSKSWSYGPLADCDPKSDFINKWRQTSGMDLREGNNLINTNIPQLENTLGLRQFTTLNKMALEEADNRTIA